MDTEIKDLEIGKDRLIEFINESDGLRIIDQDDSHLKIQQNLDKKILNFDLESLSSLLTRFDEKGDKFLQVNFNNDCKILVTDRLIGFKPFTAVQSLSINVQLPNVVTTPDLMSVIEAIENSLFSTDGSDQEVDALRALFKSVLDGAEKVGFVLKKERFWLRGLNFPQQRGAA